MEESHGMKLAHWPFIISQIVIVAVTAFCFDSYQQFLDNNVAWVILSVLFVVTVTPRLNDTGIPNVVSILLSVTSMLLLWCLKDNMMMVLSYSFAVWGYAMMIPDRMMQQIADF